MTHFRPLMGQENEVAFTVIGRDGVPLPRGRYAKKLVTEAVSSLPHIVGCNKADFFLGNGGRLYVDAGQHPEWATPECLSPFDVITWREAGEAILAKAADSIEQADSAVAEIMLARISGDYSTGATRGGHESYLVRQSLGVHAQEIVPHLVSRIVFTGAGGFDNTTQSGRFMVSPRVAHLGRVISHCSTGKRGIFHTREEPLCSGNFHRMHVLAGENLMSHTSDVLRMGTTALVAFAIDAGARPSTKVAIADAVKAMRTISFDPECSKTVQLIRGRPMRAIDIQWHYLACVERVRDKPGFPPWGQEICRLWREILTLLDDDPQRLDTVLDWRIKMSFFRSVTAKIGKVTWGELQEHRPSIPGIRSTGGDVGKPRRVLLRNALWQLRDKLCELDVKFCRVGERSVFRRLEESGLASHRLVEQEEIDAAIHAAPEGRATVRGQAIRDIYRLPWQRQLHRADWTAIHDLPKKRKLDFSDPYSTGTAEWKAATRDRTLREELVF